ncbi:MAG: hypothetical protein K6T35_08255 [Meiothermus silvanus]|nr:hypothetical protein [Allomeiothermus silvanus]
MDEKRLLVEERFKLFHLPFRHPLPLVAGEFQNLLFGFAVVLCGEPLSFCLRQAGLSRQRGEKDCKNGRSHCE